MINLLSLEKPEIRAGVNQFIWYLMKYPGLSYASAAGEVLAIGKRYYNTPPETKLSGDKYRGFAQPRGYKMPVWIQRASLDLAIEYGYRPETYNELWAMLETWLLNYDKRSDYDRNQIEKEFYAAYPFLKKEWTHEIQLLLKDYLT